MNSQLLGSTTATVSPGPKPAACSPRAIEYIRPASSPYVTLRSSGSTSARRAGSFAAAAKTPKSVTPSSVSRRALGHVAERHVAVVCHLARHTEHSFRDVVACHLGGAAADAGGLAHEEVHARAAPGRVVLRAHRTRARELELD